MVAAQGGAASEDRLRRTLAAGELLFQQGQQGSAAFVIESGSIEIFSERGDVVQVIACLGANEIFGEMALLGDAIRTASARAAEPTQLLVVTNEHLNERLQSADPMTRHLLRTVVTRCREMLAWMRAGGATRAVVQTAASVLSAIDDPEVADREQAFGRVRTEQELELALERKEFQLFFQPIIRLSTSEIAGFEALIRWFKPGHGMVPPNVFIPVAEASNLINRMGLWILDNAVENLLVLLESRKPSDEPLFMTVNLSARQLTDPALLPALAMQAERIKGKHCQLKLEITESLMIGNVVEVQAFIAHCRNLGFKVVLDDFGTGYCSLSYLHLFDVQTMKLDCSFTRGMSVSPASEKVVLGVTRMAHDLGLDVVVEGVETEDQARQAASLDIDFAQGYYFGRPAAIDKALAKLAE